MELITIFIIFIFHEAVVEFYYVYAFIISQYIFPPWIFMYLQKGSILV